jgi:hypothetical protein
MALMLWLDGMMMMMMMMLSNCLKPALFVLVFLPLLLLLLPGMMAAVSGDKAPDKTQGELTGLLKAMGYTQEQVYKF